MTHVIVVTPKKLMIAVLMTELTALYWGLVYHFTGIIPEVTSLVLTDDYILQLPFVISRWWDIACIPLWIALLSLSIPIHFLEEDSSPEDSDPSKSVAVEGQYEHDGLHDFIVNLKVSIYVATTIGTLVGLVYGLNFSLGFSAIFFILMSIIFFEDSSIPDRIQIFIALVCTYGIGIGIGMSLTTSQFIGLIIATSFVLVYRLFVWTDVEITRILDETDDEGKDRPQKNTTVTPVE